MIVVVGLNHVSAPLAVREVLAFSNERMAEALTRMKSDTGCSEAMILSTCNRVELYARHHDGAAAVACFLYRFHGRSAEEVEPHLYRFAGEAAVRHAFRVAASLDSMVVGEPQILGQVREAYQMAEQAGALGTTLQTLRSRSLAVAKRARTETGIGENAVSVSCVAVELARKIFGELKDKNVLLVGAGKMSHLAAHHLVQSGARATVLGGRTFARAEELAAALGARAAPFEALRSEMERTDIVISGTGAPGIVIHRQDVEVACIERGARPLFIIDIAVPRDVDPAVDTLPDVFLYDLDHLKSVAESNLKQRQRQAVAAEAIVEAEVRAFLDWQRSLEVVPFLVDMREKADRIRREEIGKARRRFGTLTSEQEQALQALTEAIVNKLLHPPTVELKRIASESGAPDAVALARRLLGL